MSSSEGSISQQFSPSCSSYIHLAPSVRFPEPGWNGTDTLIKIYYLRISEHSLSPWHFGQSCASVFTEACSKKKIDSLAKAECSTGAGLEWLIPKVSNYY